MTSDVARAIAVDGVLLRREAIEAGIDDNALRRLVRSGLLVRLRQGIYAITEIYRAASPPERHLMAVEGVMRLYDVDVAVSHSSAAIVHGAPDWGLPLGSVHLTHFEGGGRTGARIVHHHGECRLGDVTLIDDRWVTSPARTIHDTTAIAGAEAGLVLANDFLHRGLTTIAELLYFEESRTHWPHSLSMHPVLHLADRRIESVGESRCQYLFWTQGLPAPEPQFDVLGYDGRLLGRVDFAWPELGVFCEFDGEAKYTRLRREGETIEQTVLREKGREQAIIEATGWRVIRLTWADLQHPARTAARIRRLLARAA